MAVAAIPSASVGGQYGLAYFRILFAVALAVVAAGPPLPAAAQTLDPILRDLVDDSPIIRSQRKAVESARQGVRIGDSGFLPKLDVTAEVGPEYIDSPITAQTEEEESVEIKQIYGARLSQRVFDGFATLSDARAARLELEVAEFTLTRTRQSVLFDGIAAYIEVLRQQQLVELARTNEETIRRQLSLEDERVRRGAGIAVDVLQAKSRLQVAKERRVAFESGLKDAAARFMQIFGFFPEIGAMRSPTPPEGLVPDSIEAAVRIAEGENPAIDASLATIEVTSERRRRARSDYFPTVDVVAAANREENSDLIRGTRKDASIVVQATWNLFNGFATDAGVAQAAFDYRASQDNHEQTRREVVESARLAWHERESARERVDLLENAVDIAAEVFEARRRLREMGKETALNVLDAERELITARINLATSKADFKIATYRLLLSLGRLDTAHLALDYP